MSLAASFGLLLEEYTANKDKKFAKNFLADFVRSDIPQNIQQLLPAGGRYLTKGSVGQGNWANVPWVAIFDRLITHSAQDGFYIVYLVKEDCSGIYLSLNQGVTTVRESYGASAKDALQARASNYVAKLGGENAGLVVGPIDLALTGNAGIASFYESGAILSKYYTPVDLVDDAQVSRDLRAFVGLYNRLYEAELSAVGLDQEDDEIGLNVEDCLNLKAHKRLERNQKLAQDAKAFHGFVCQACNFDFEK
ncbi:MAG: DUF3578 domain-containing protein, partial [Gammaproteobacteria bacterium]|nr:DUF3578 domain-containing protein [Gammaproteobacteria bacterium]